MLLKEAEAAALAAAVLEGGSMKLSGVASWPAAGHRVGATAPFPSVCVCIWSCCGVNLSLCRRSTLGRDAPAGFVTLSGALKGLWLAIRLVWHSSGTGWFSNGDLCLGVVFTACIIVLFRDRLGGTCAAGASPGRVGLRTGLNGIV